MPLTAFDKAWGVVKAEPEDGPFSNARADFYDWSMGEEPEPPCDPPCVPRPMLGRSWWKNLGYNSPCGCAQTLAYKGYQHMSEHWCGHCGQSKPEFEDDDGRR